MGADIVVAVNVGTPLLKREQLNGILGVTGQMLNILTEQNVQASLAQLKPGDILVTPELGEYTTGDFDHLPQIVPLGEAAARRVVEKLAKLALPADEYAALRRRQLVAVTPDVRPVDEIRVTGLQLVNPQAVTAAMDTQSGKPIDQETLDRDMRRVYGLGSFEHVNYRFLEEPNRRVLVVDAVEKSWGQDNLRFGLGLSSDFKSDAYFNLLGSYRRYWINALGAEWRTDLQVGRTSGLYSEFYQPINPAGQIFLVPHVAYLRRVTDLYQGNDQVARYSITTRQAGISVGSLFGRYGESRLGIVRGVEHPSLVIGPPSLSPGADKVDRGAYTAAVTLDQLDSISFPRAGWRSGLRVFRSSSQLGADDDYTKWDVDGNAAYSFGGHTVSVAAKLGGSIGADPLPRYDLFQWGGFLQQSGYATGQLIGQSIRFGRLMYYHRILRGTFFEGAYAGASLEFGKVGTPLVPGSPEGWLRSMALFIAADSPVGPVYLGYGHGEGGNSSLYFYLGRPF